MKPLRPLPFPSDEKSPEARAAHAEAPDIQISDIKDLSSRREIRRRLSEEGFLDSSPEVRTLFRD